jgi:ethanolamine utilization microcompartment shell protein EutS
MGSQGAMALIGSTLALNAGGVTLGAAASEPVMGSVALLAWVGQVNAALAAISAAAGQTVNPTITPPVAAPLASTSVKMAM